MSYKIKDLPTREKPREKAIQEGISSLSVGELLAILLRTGSKEESAKDLGIHLLKEVGGLEGLKNIRLSSLTSIHGIGTTKAITLMAAIELGKRIYELKVDSKIKIQRTSDVYKYYHRFFTNETQEKFCVLFLNTKNVVIGQKIIFVGTANQSVIHPREIFREAVLHNAVKIICMHNHPSGEVSPSIEDYATTKKLVETGKILNIPVLDHVILGHNKYYSFAEEGECL